MRKTFSVPLFLLAGYIPLNVRETGWTIAGIRHYLNGDSVFKLEVIAKIPRS